MKLIWSDIALARIDSIHDYIRVDQPAAATRVVKRLQQAGGMIAEFPQSGRPLRRKGAFIYAVPKTSYLIVYKHAPDTITIATILHGSENWWKQFPLR
jgi:toxin ParE1/3/4